MDSDWEYAPIPDFGTWCPDCKDHANNLTDNANLVYCSMHTPTMKGNADPEWEYQGTGMDDDVPAKLCNLIHRGDIDNNG